MLKCIGETTLPFGHFKLLLVGKCSLPAEELLQEISGASCYAKMYSEDCTASRAVFI